MARPVKRRRVCGLPRRNRFEPIGVSKNNLETINMTVEEYQTINLIDLEGLTQEECAELMGVARATVQRIYFKARRKIAKFLIDDKALVIGGGNYVLCDESEYGYLCRRCGRGPGRRGNRRGRGNNLI